MRSFVAAVLSIVASSSSIAEEQKAEPTVPAFPVYYAMVSHLLKHDAGCFDKLMANPAMKGLSEFWWGYILKDCDTYVTKQIEYIAKQGGRSTKSPGVDQAAMEKTQDIMKQCAMSVILDNWDRINETISPNPVMECRSKPN